MLLVGVALGHGQSEIVGLSLRPLRARMAATRQVAGPDGLSEMQEPVLEHASAHAEGRAHGLARVGISSWSASHKRARFGGVPEGGCGWGVRISLPATTVAATWRKYNTPCKLAAHKTRGLAFCAASGFYVQPRFSVQSHLLHHGTIPKRCRCDFAGTASRWSSSRVVEPAPYERANRGIQEHTPSDASPCARACGRVESTQIANGRADQENHRSPKRARGAVRLCAVRV